MSSSAFVVYGAEFCRILEGEDRTQAAELLREMGVPEPLDWDPGIALKREHNKLYLQ